MKENSGQDRKQKIRDKYKGTDASEIEIIPAKPTADFMESGGIRRVAAYVRVSTDNDEQTSSYELQKNYYTEYITGHPGWELVGIYPSSFYMQTPSHSAAHAPAEYCCSPLK